MRPMNEEELEKKADLEAAGFGVQVEWDGTEWLFHAAPARRGTPIGPMNDREVFWMLEGWKAGKLATV